LEWKKPCQIHLHSEEHASQIFACSRMLSPKTSGRAKGEKEKLLSVATPGRHFATSKYFPRNSQQLLPGKELISLSLSLSLSHITLSSSQSPRHLRVALVHQDSEVHLDSCNPLCMRSSQSWREPNELKEKMAHLK
jgi:hypothetical protein